jgi:hypothetical protein
MYQCKEAFTGAVQADVTPRTGMIVISLKTY